MPLNRTITNPFGGNTAVIHFDGIGEQYMHPIPPSVTDGNIFSDTPPVLTSAAVTTNSNGPTHADFSVSTDQDNGTLYYLVSANATETKGTVVGGPSGSQAVSATGTQTVTNYIGWVPGSIQYVHFVHENSASSQSDVASASLTTTAYTGSATYSGNPIPSSSILHYFSGFSEAENSLRNAQDETNYDNSPTTEGTFVGGDGAGGTAYSVSDTITLTGGTIITVDAVDGNGDVTQFTVNSIPDTTGGHVENDTLIQTATSGTGAGFTLTVERDNLRKGTGAHTGANNASSLTDSAAAWTTNEWNNYEVKNTSDGSKGTVTANTATNVTATLSGGTESDWDTSENYAFQHPTIATDANQSWTNDELIDLIVRNVTDGSEALITDNTATTITVSALTGGTDNAFGLGDEFAVEADIDTPDIVYHEATTTVTSESASFKYYVYDNSGTSYTATKTATLTTPGTPDGNYTVSLDTEGTPTLTAVAASIPSVSAQVISGALPTSGSQDYTVSGFGTPKAVMIFTSGGVTDETIATDAIIGIGFTDGTNQAAVGISTDESPATSNANRAHSDAHVVYLPDPSTNATLLCSLTATIINNGVRLTVDTAPSSAYLISVVLLGGDDILNAEVLSSSLGNGVGDQAITMTGSFTPDLVFGITDAANSTLPSVAAGVGHLSFGVSDFTTNRGIYYSTMDGVAGTQLTAYYSNAGFIGQCFNNALTYQGAAEDAASGTFNVNTTVAAGNDIASFLVLEFDAGVSTSIHDVVIGSAADVNETDPSFLPNFTLCSFMEGISTVNTVTDNFIGSNTITIFDDLTTNTLSYAIDDGAGSTPKKSVHSDSLFGLNGDGSTTSYEGTVAFDSLGYNMTTTTRPSSDILGWGFSINGTAATTTASASSNTAGGPIFEAFTLEEEEELERLRRAQMEDDVLGFGLEQDNTGIDYDLDR